MIVQRNQILVSILFLLILTSLACKLPEKLVATPTSTLYSPLLTPAKQTTSNPPQTRVTPNPTVPSTPLLLASTHRIATHRIYGIAEFYDRLTATRFIPRGVNYFMLVPVLDHYEDRLFAVGLYDHDRVKTDLSNLSAAGYNTIRILLDGCNSGDICIGNKDGQGLNPSYLDNIVDLMQLAKTANLFIFFTSQDLPESGGYAALANQGANSYFAAGRNAEYLTPSGIHATQIYWSDLLTGLAKRNAPFEVILGWELVSEQYYYSDQPPFSMERGRVTAANGTIYSMSSTTQKRKMAVDGMRYYIDQMRQTILTYDPTALVSMGFLAPNSPNAWHEDDNRYVETGPLLDDSSLDFYDLHANPVPGTSIDELAQNFGLGSHVNKPVIMGEVGASTWSYPEIFEGAIAVQDWIVSSCSIGFSGWLYYGYYPFPAGLVTANWGLVDEKETLLIALSPKNQPDACTVSVLPGRNLALKKTVEVSAALPDQTAEMSVDGDPNTQWSAGGFPTQWIQIDLGTQYAVGEVRLTMGQWPAGQTKHQLWLGSSPDDMQLVYEFAGYETDFDVLNYVPTNPLKNIRYVRVVTTESPSWVSWREIEVLAPFPGTPTATPSLTATP